MDLAVSEINSMGGVLGKKLELVAADDGNNNELARIYADSLIRKYKISALIGPSSSRRLIHLANTYLPSHPMLVISPSASQVKFHTSMTMTLCGEQHQVMNNKPSLPHTTFLKN